MHERGVKKGSNVKRLKVKKGSKVKRAESKVKREGVKYRGQMSRLMNGWTFTEFISQ